MLILADVANLVGGVGAEGGFLCLLRRLFRRKRGIVLMRNKYLKALLSNYPVGPPCPLVIPFRPDLFPHFILLPFSGALSGLRATVSPSFFVTFSKHLSASFEAAPNDMAGARYALQWTGYGSLASAMDIDGSVSHYQVYFTRLYF